MLVELIKDGDIAIPPVDRLLSSMCEHSKPINPKLLGTIGREHITTRMVTDYEVEAESIKYFHKVGENPLPYVLEIGFGIYREGFDNRPQTLITGLNWSPTMRSPIYELTQALQEIRADSRDPVCVVVHIAMPHFEYTERGKGHANV
jgi:hypothetical protein